jgi:hypothetical protein
MTRLFYVTSLRPDAEFVPEGHESANWQVTAEEARQLGMTIPDTKELKEPVADKMVRRPVTKKARR